LSELEKSLSSQDEAEELRCQLMLGESHLDYNHPNVARANFTRGLALARALETIPAVVQAQMGLGLSLMHGGSNAEAAQVFHDVLRAALARSDPDVVCLAHLHIGKCERRIGGRLISALEHLNHALSEAEGLSNQAVRVEILFDLSVVHREANNSQFADECYSQAMALLRPLWSSIDMKTKARLNSYMVTQLD
jgi:hypothetical protein